MDLFRKQCPRCEKRGQARYMEKTVSPSGEKEWRCSVCNYFENRLL